MKLKRSGATSHVAVTVTWWCLSTGITLLNVRIADTQFVFTWKLPYKIGVLLISLNFIKLIAFCLVGIVSEYKFVLNCSHVVTLVRIFEVKNNKTEISFRRKGDVEGMWCTAWKVWICKICKNYSCPAFRRSLREHTAGWWVLYHFSRV